MAMDTPALGGGTPRYGMLRSGLWWVESFGWTILAWLILGGPYLGLALFSAPGMVLGVFWLASGWYLMGNPISFLGRPRRLLDDLWARLSVPGSGDARTVTLWSLSWGTARGLVLAYYAFLTLLGVVTFTVLIVAALSGHGVGVTISDNYRTIATLLDALAYGSAFVAETIAYLLLAQVTLGLVDRLKVRERWVKGSAVDPGPAGGQGPDPAFAAPNDPYEYIPPDVRVASQPPASVVQPVPLAGTSFSPQPGKSTPQADQPAGPSIAAPSPGLAAHPVPRSWPAPIQFSDAAPDTGEPPRFDPRAWVPPRPVFTAPQVTAAAPADAVAAPARPGEARKSPRLESVSPAAPALPAEAGWPVELEPRPARDQGPAPADDMGWGEGL
jgi:hypothetical protein